VEISPVARQDVDDRSNVGSDSETKPWCLSVVGEDGDVLGYWSSEILGTDLGRDLSGPARGDRLVVFGDRAAASGPYFPNLERGGALILDLEGVTNDLSLDDGAGVKHGFGHYYLGLSLSNGHSGNAKDERGAEHENSGNGNFDHWELLKVRITGDGLGPLYRRLSSISDATSMLYCAALRLNENQAERHENQAERPATSQELHDVLDIYCIALGGTGMAPLACLLEEMGHRVRGSDNPLYPPMSTLLADAGIVPEVGFDIAHLEVQPDLVIVGNAVPRSNPEALAVEERGWPRISMPQALARFILANRRPLVVSGTHGKTTTTSMAAWTLDQLGADPGYLIGGVPLNSGRSFHLGAGSRFVIEGDEYNAAYFDRGPKFLHYLAETLIVTSVEHDHVDLYPTPASLRAAFAELIAGLPATGHLIACGDSPEVRELVALAPCRVTLYGLGPGNGARAFPGPAGKAAGLQGPDGLEASLTLQVPGRHNLSNALAVWVAVCAEGYDAQLTADALGRFGGVQRRLEELGTESEITVVDDFAHHPTAVAASLQALREGYPNRRLVVLFEPRSLTAGREFFQQAYCEAFSAADEVIVAPIFYAERLAANERLDVELLRSDLASRDVRLSTPTSLDNLVETGMELAEPGDVLVCMSSGSFGNVPRRLLDGLRRRC
jgi:UDP-N-acetylmuramate: L-alanyl-gamma-D-glutamyl-meso-diaminopimelate ligase